MSVTETQPVDVDAAVADMLRALGDGAVTVSTAVRKSASRDYFWLSPLLAERLPATVPDVVAYPASDTEVARILDIAVRHRIPVTPRGKGTGNYGQAVPLNAGLVIDLSRHRQIVEVADGWIEAGAGASFADLESAARNRGQELAVFPSMARSSLGGFLSGGNQGIGSIENGSIWDGYVGAVTVVACCEEVMPTRLVGDAARPHLHTYGTAGLLASARVRLVPAREWTALFASFETATAAASSGIELMGLDPRPRALSVDDAELAALFPDHVGIPERRVSLRAIVAVDAVEAAGRVVADHGGRVECVDADAVGLVVTTSFNHSTLRAKRAHPDLCATQVRGPQLMNQADEIRAVLPGSMLHLDGNSKSGGAPGYSALLLAPFMGADALYAAMERLRALGLTVIDPHTWRLGGHGGLDGIRRAAVVFDPHRLLNPGKLPAA